MRARWPRRAAAQLPLGEILSAAAASAANTLEPLAQLGFLAVLGELEKALADRVVGHQLLVGHTLRTGVRVVIVEPPAELLRARVGGAPQSGRRLGRAVLAHPGARPLDALVRGVRLRRQREVNRRLGQVE